MNCSKYSSIVVIIILLLIIMISFLSYYYREHYENKKTFPLWYNEIMEEFYALFDRPLDPVHMAYYKKITSNHIPSKSLSIIKNDLKKYKREVEEGKQKIKNSKIVIAGLLQNGAKQIPELMERCKKITSYFKDYRIVILENNSIDTSRKDLLYWAFNDDRVKILCQDPFVANSEECRIDGETGVKDTSPMPNRIRKMATLRNIYMNHIYHYYKNFDYLCVIDMDLEGEFFIDGFLHAAGLLGPKIDGVACNGMLKTDDGGFYYYDSFAYIEENDLPYMTDISQKSEHDDYVHIYMTQLYSNQMIPDRVRSAFGGCVLYNMKSVINNRYDFSQSTFMCEHTFFHQGKNIYVDPRMIFFITKNG